ncbi:glycoside hydrolase family 88 protein [Actinoplanes sp. NPDC051851]|uniref:glycoside hydrolase family 88 protein n=1 Tax=Actinoplanes sp. NPDC051851 TaxID=3154753 RepID=UPI003448A6DC
MTAIDVRAGFDAGAVGAAVSAALRTIDVNLSVLGDRYPGDTTVEERYRLRPAAAGQPVGSNVGWTASFWPGMLWLAYDLTGEERYLTAATGHIADFAERIDRRIDIETHDLGFLYILSCVVGFRRTGEKQARQAALTAADRLMDRVLEPAGIIQAWGDLSNPAQRGRTIIDSLMNTPLLFWASRESGDGRYADAARRHIAQLRDHILRPDGTTYHTFYWDPVTGEPLRGETEQGHADDSCWARGQAWGIYGFTLNHRHTGDPTLLTAARRCADHFLASLPDDHVPYWDLALTDEERDSSAAAIAVCGLLELADALDGTEAGGGGNGSGGNGSGEAGGGGNGSGEAGGGGNGSGDHYRTAAGRILASLISGYATAGQPRFDALLRHGVYDKPKNVGVDEGTLWGDYFYLEALTRVTRPEWNHPW